MTRPSTVAAGLAVTNSQPAAASGGLVRTPPQSQRSRPLLRKYEIWALDASDTLVDLSRIAPATAPFEACFGVLARGALLATPNGPRAIEDILPGDVVLTRNTGPQVVQWSGAMSLLPANPSGLTDSAAPAMTAQLTRIAADSLGLGRPIPDLVLGPAAHLLHSPAALPGLYGVRSCFAPATGLIDGEAILAIRPVSPVKLYQIMVPVHDTVLVNGVDVETLHPGPQIEAVLNRELLDLFMAMFPCHSSIEDFGPMAHPRLSLAELEAMQAA